MPLIVADNGAFQLRLGRAGAEEGEVVVMPNQTAVVRNDTSGARELIGDETNSTDASSSHRTLQFSRAHDRGCLVDKHVEELVWTRALQRLNIDMTTNNSRGDVDLIVTETPLVPATCARLADELFFEYFSFNRVARVQPQVCVARDWSSSQHKCSPLVQVVVDCGYSSTWIVPLLGGNAIWPHSMRRIDLGGKALTNLLKEDMSWRHVNLMDSVALVEECKLLACYVRLLHKGQEDKSSVIHYLLPDFRTDMRGRVLSSPAEAGLHRQIIRLSALERTSPGEALFCPSRIGLDQMGLHEAISDCVQSLPTELQREAKRNVLVTGGTACMPHLCDRLRQELFCDDDDDGGVVVHDWSGEHVLSAWRGAALLGANEHDYAAHAQTKQQYEEDGCSNVQHRQKRRRQQQHAQQVVAAQWWGGGREPLHIT